METVETENITVQIPNVFREYLIEETRQRDQNSFSRSPVHFQSAGQLEIMEANRLPESLETYGLSEMELDDLILFLEDSLDTPEADNVGDAYGEYGWTGDKWDTYRDLQDSLEEVRSRYQLEAYPEQF